MLAKRYEEIWHEEFYKLKRWLQETITQEPLGRHASAFAHEVSLLAEGRTDTPSHLPEQDQ